MVAKIKIKEINWEKITVYLTITIAFLSICSQLFKIKDDVHIIAERTAKLEVKVDHLEISNK